MSKRKHPRTALARAFACALALVAALAAANLFDSRAAAHRARAATAQGGGRADIRLRSLTTRATGKLTVEASEGGGRARLTALNLPDPQTVAADARTYVAWAVSGGRILRLGELKRDERGNGGLAFDRPEGFERYGVIVTAESSAEAERPSDPVLTTRADEAAALYPKEEAAGAGASTPAPPVPDVSPKSNAGAPAFDFYSEVDDALVSNGGGRGLQHQSGPAAPDARGAARAPPPPRRPAGP